MANPIIICGQQRSGTTALRSALSQVDGVCDFGEIFQFNQTLIEEAAHNFYHYANQIHGAWVPLTSHEQAEAELTQYLNHLENLAPGSFFLADIKYNFWHHFAPGWLNPFGRPFMLEYFKKRKTPILHLVRHNLFRQYVSHEFAARARRWHYGNERAETPAIAPFDIDTQDLAEYFEMVEGNVQLFRKRLKNYPYAVELSYESLFDGRQLTENAQRELRRILPGWILKGGESKFVKPGLDSMAWVRNPEAVIDAFRETRYGVMVIDALRPPLPECSNGVVADGRQEQAADPVKEGAQDEDGGDSAKGSRADGKVGPMRAGDDHE